MTKILFSYAVNRRIIIRSYAEYLRRAYGVRSIDLGIYLPFYADVAYLVC